MNDASTPKTPSICTDPKCSGNIQGFTNHSHLSMPDPCPHITRFQLIRAKLHNECNELEVLTDHLTTCGRG